MMKIFGYSKNDDDSLLKIKEITFQADAKTLRAISKFLEKCAKDIESNSINYEHSHLRDEWLDWKKDFPDIIVYNPEK